MASLQSISAAIDSINSKKKDVRKAFEDLQSHSCLLASFTLKWKDLEDHFDAIERSIDKRFKELASEESSAARATAKTPTDSKPQPLSTSSSNPVILVWPELKTLCAKMDAKELRNFMVAHRKDGADMRSELDDALRCSPDPAKLVLDAIEGFFPPNFEGGKGVEVAATRRACIMLLERLTVIRPVITESTRERAKKVALDCKGKVGEEGVSENRQLECLGFLQLLAAFDLGQMFGNGEVLDMVVLIGRRKQAVDLCRALGVVEKIPDLIQKFISKGKQIEAVNFIYSFNLAEKFPVVPLLKAYIKESKKLAQEVLKKGKNSSQSMNEAIAKELAALNSVKKIIEDRNLQSEYPCDEVEKQIALLEKKKEERKRNSSKSFQSHTTNKRPRQAGPTTEYQSRPSGLLQSPLNPPYAGNTGMYAPTLGVGAVAGSSAGTYGLAGGSGAMPVSSSPFPMTGGPGMSVPTYGMAGGPGSITDSVYDRGSYLSGTHPAYVGSRSPPRPPYPLHTVESLSSALYDKPPSYGGYPAPRGVPQYDTSYYSGY